MSAWMAVKGQEGKRASPWVSGEKKIGYLLKVYLVLITLAVCYI